MRFTPVIGTAPARLNYDYFLKDHLGNVRMVLTDEHETCTYPAATLEGNGTTASVPNALFKEKEYYDINEDNIVDVPDAHAINYPNNNGIDNNNPYSDKGATTQKMYQLKASNGVAATGLGIILKVMSGDKIDIFGKSYYDMDNSGTHQNYSLLVENLLAGFLGGPAGLGAVKSVTANSLSKTQAVAGAIGGFLNDPQRGDNTDDKPRAYINYILLDNQFHYVSGGFSRVGGLGSVKDHFSIDPKILQNIPVTKNGYLYVYCSNESDVKVYFDNLQVVHTKGALLEETHYYPFGLTMAGISDKAAKSGYFENNYKFNEGVELQHHEFGDGSGLELYATDFRSYDPQIGCFHQKDPLALLNPDYSSYSFVQNNPLLYNDPIGLDTFPVTGRLPQGTKPAMVNVPNPTGGTSFYLYDPNNPNADQDGLIPQGIVEGPEEAVTVTAKSKKGNKKAANSASAGTNTAGTNTGSHPATPGNTGNAVGNATASQRIAANLINSRRITFSDTHPNRVHPSDMANADDNIRDAAAGGLVHTSEYGHARGVMVALDPRLLTMIEQLSREYTFNIIELAGARHGENSRHYAGIAVDITEINGIPVTARNPFYRAMMRRARELGAQEVLGPGTADHDTHLHFGMPRR